MKKISKKNWIISGIVICIILFIVGGTFIYQYPVRYINGKLLMGEQKVFAERIKEYYQEIKETKEYAYLNYQVKVSSINDNGSIESDVELWQGLESMEFSAKMTEDNKGDDRKTVTASWTLEGKGYYQLETSNKSIDEDEIDKCYYGKLDDDDFIMRGYSNRSSIDSSEDELSGKEKIGFQMANVSYMLNNVNFLIELSEFFGDWDDDIFDTDSEWDGKEYSVFSMEFKKEDSQNISGDVKINYPEDIKVYFDSEDYSFQGYEILTSNEKVVMKIENQEYSNTPYDKNYDVDSCIYYSSKDPLEAKISYEGSVVSTKFDYDSTSKEDSLKIDPGTEEWAQHMRLFSDETFMMAISKKDWDTLTIAQINGKVIDAYAPGWIKADPSPSNLKDWGGPSIEFSNSSYYSMTRKEILEYIKVAGITKEDYKNASARNINRKLQEAGLSSILTDESKPLSDTYKD